MNPSISYQTDNKQSNLDELTSNKLTQVPTIWQSTGAIAKNRLIVLVPPQICNEADFSKYIIKLASANNSDVLLIMVVSNYEDETTGRLRVSTISAYLSGFAVKVEIQIIWGKSWINSIEQIIQPGDAIICPTELNTKTKIIFREQLSDQLVRNLNAPVNAYSGFVIQAHTTPREILMKLLYWVGIILIVVGFFYVETTIDKSVIGWVNNFIEILLVIVEVGALYLWSSLLG
jgi:hypothetical protein